MSAPSGIDTATARGVWLRTEQANCVRACRFIGVDRTSVRYQRTTPDDAELRARIKALAHERRRFGYRRL